MLDLWIFAVAVLAGDDLTRLETRKQPLQLTRLTLLWYCTRGRDYLAGDFKNAGWKYSRQLTRLPLPTQREVATDRVGET